MTDDIFEDKYIVVTPNGTTPIWSSNATYESPVGPLTDTRPKIVLGDKVLAYEWASGETGGGNETLKLLGTTSTKAGAETVFASRELGDSGDEHHRWGGMYAYGNKVALLGFQTVWEVDATGVQTIVPIVPAMQASLPPTHYVDNGNQRSLRTYSDWFALLGPEDAVMWAVPVEGDERAATPVWHGFVKLDNPDFETMVYEDLVGYPPETFSPSVTGTMTTAWGTIPGMYFNRAFDPELSGGLPIEFWEAAIFHYTWKAGWPSAGIPGGGTCQVRLMAEFEGSTGPIAGDGMGDELTGTGFLADAGWEAALGDPYYSLSLGFYVSPTTGPGYNANLSAGIESASINGSYTVEYAQPWRQTWPRSEYEFFPALDLAIVTPDLSSWGAPAAGGGVGTNVHPALASWWRSTRFLTAVAAQTRQTHYPIRGPGGTSYDINDFTIALRWDDPLLSNLTADLDLTRARFVRSNP